MTREKSRKEEKPHEEAHDRDPTERKMRKERNRESKDGTGRWGKLLHLIKFRRDEQKFAPLHEEEKKNLAKIPPHKMDPTNQALLEKAQKIETIKNIPPKKRGQKGTTKKIIREIGAVVHKVDIPLAGGRKEEREALTVVPYNPKDAKIPPVDVTNVAKIEALSHTHPSPGRATETCDYQILAHQSLQGQERRQYNKLTKKVQEIRTLDTPSGLDVIQALRTKHNLPHIIVTPYANIVMTPKDPVLLDSTYIPKIEKLIRKADVIAMKKAGNIPNTFAGAERLVQNYQAIRAQTIPAALAREYNLKVMILPKGVRLPVAGSPPETVPNPTKQAKRAKRRSATRTGREPSVFVKTTTKSGSKFVTSKFIAPQIDETKADLQKSLEQAERERTALMDRAAKAKIGVARLSTLVGNARHEAKLGKASSFHKVMASFYKAMARAEQRIADKEKCLVEKHELAAKYERDELWKQASQDAAAHHARIVEARAMRRAAKQVTQSAPARSKRVPEAKRKVKRSRPRTVRAHTGRVPRSKREFYQAIEKKFGPFAVEGANIDYDSTLTPSENWTETQREIRQEAFAFAQPSVKKKPEDSEGVAK